MWFKKLLPRLSPIDEATRALLKRMTPLLASMSTDGATALARRYLADSEKFVVKPAGSRCPAVAAALGPGNRSFVESYAEIEMQYGAFKYRQSEVVPSSLLDGGIRLAGTTEHADVIARPPGDEVFVLDGTELPSRMLDDRHRSIWHFILWQTLTVYPELVDELEEARRERP